MFISFFLHIFVKNKNMENIVLWILVNIVLWIIVGGFYLLICFITWSWLPYSPIVLRSVGVLIAIMAAMIVKETE